MFSFRDIIGLWKTPDYLAAEIGVKASTTRHWKTNNRIPQEYWKAVQLAARAKGVEITAQTFLDIAALCRDDGRVRRSL